MFGYLSNDRNSDQINLLILCAKWYIFQCAKNNKILNIYNFQKKYKSACAEQITLLKLKQIEKNVSLKTGLHGNLYLRTYSKEVVGKAALIPDNNNLLL